MPVHLSFEGCTRPLIAHGVDGQQGRRRFVEPIQHFAPLWLAAVDVKRKVNVRARQMVAARPRAEKPHPANRKPALALGLQGDCETLGQVLRQGRTKTPVAAAGGGSVADPFWRDKRRLTEGRAGNCNRSGGPVADGGYATAVALSDDPKAKEPVFTDSFLAIQAPATTVRFCPGTSPS